MSQEIKILIADDHPIFRKGLVNIISADRRFVIADEAADGETALELTLKLKPRIALLDIDMPKLNGLGLAECSVPRYFVELFPNEFVETGAIHRGRLRTKTRSSGSESRSARAFGGSRCEAPCWRAG